MQLTTWLAPQSVVYQPSRQTGTVDGLARVDSVPVLFARLGSLFVHLLFFMKLVYALDLHFICHYSAALIGSVSRVAALAVKPL